MWRIVRDAVRVADPLSPGRSFRFPAANRRLRKRAQRIGSKEPGTVRWLDTTLRPGDVFHDVGANIGIYSVFAAARCGRVVSFEPHAANFAMLLESIALNGMADRILPLSVALDAECGGIDFTYRALAAGSTGSQLASSPLAAAALDSGGGAAATHVVERKLAQSLDALVAAGVVPAPTVVKIDVDGSEPNILRGMRGLLATHAVRSLQVEVDPSQATAVDALLAEAGYAREHVHQSRAGQRHLDRGGSPDGWPSNVVFAPRGTPPAAAP
jgi:FkbM family methyltransferase